MENKETLVDVVNTLERNIELSGSLGVQIKDNSANAKTALIRIIKFYEEKIKELGTQNKNLIKENAELKNKNNKIHTKE